MNLKQITITRRAVCLAAALAVALFASQAFAQRKHPVSTSPQGKAAAVGGVVGSAPRAGSSSDQKMSWVVGAGAAFRRSFHAQGVSALRSAFGETWSRTSTR